MRRTLNSSGISKDFSVRKMPLAQYLELTRRLRKHSQFHLTHQANKDGWVYFTDESSIKRLLEIIHHQNDGLLPSVEKIKNEERKKMQGDSINAYEYREFYEGVKGPDGDGWYTARCPVCEWHGRDSDHNHFRFTEDGTVHCFVGHSGSEIHEAIRAMIEGRAPQFKRAGKSKLKSDTKDLEAFAKEFEEMAKGMKKAGE